MLTELTNGGSHDEYECCKVWVRPVHGVGRGVGVGFLGKKDKFDARRAAELWERDEAFVLDVREPDEWKAGHIPGATHIPLGELGQRFSELPRGQRIVAVCRSGNRSGRATESLRRAGLEVENLEGGMKGWHKAGLPLEPHDGRVA